MSRNIFGWDLPPGVSQRMIDEAAGGDPSAEAFEVAFHEKYEEIFAERSFGNTEEAINALREWVWTQIGNSYAEGYKQGQSDEAYAQHMKTEKEGT